MAEAIRTAALIRYHNEARFHALVDTAVRTVEQRRGKALTAQERVIATECSAVCLVLNEETAH